MYMALLLKIKIWLQQRLSHYPRVRRYICLFITKSSRKPKNLFFQNKINSTRLTPHAYNIYLAIKYANSKKNGANN